MIVIPRTIRHADVRMPAKKEGRPMKRVAAAMLVAGWALVLPVGAQVGLPVLSDSNGVVMGVVHGLEVTNQNQGFLAQVLIERGGRKFPLAVFATGIVDGRSLGRFYATPDCSGQAHFDDELVPFEGLTVASIDNAPAIDVVRVGGDPVEGFPYQSRFDLDGPCLAEIGIRPRVRPVVDTFDFSDEYPPPYTYSISGLPGPVGAVPAVSPLGLVVLAGALGVGALLVMRKSKQESPETHRR
jgi:hypothetical protein